MLHTSNRNSPSAFMMPRREDIRAVFPARNPSGLSSQSTGIWTPREPMNPLTHSSSLLVAQYDRGYYRYVRSCSVCAMSKSPRHLLVGKLVPLPVPQRHWAHIGVDFVTDLPNSEGHTCVLVDRFSPRSAD